jgi:membrane-bound inhibitor of C-type lysozyme
MNKKLKIVLTLLIIIIACFAVFFYYQKSKPASLANNAPAVTEQSIAGTYIGHLANDVYILSILSEQGESFTGTLDIKNFEKDSSTGTLSGTYKNGYLLADYTFQSEGTESVNWVAFKKVDGGFIRGSGNINPETKTQSIDLNKITFDSSVVYELSNTIVNSVTFSCDANKSIKAVFYKDRVIISLSDGRNMSLPQVLSGSGARYANFDESFVFWNKGDTAFVDEDNSTTYQNCTIKK